MSTVNYLINVKKVNIFFILIRETKGPSIKNQIWCGTIFVVWQKFWASTLYFQCLFDAYKVFWFQSGILKLSCYLRFIWAVIKFLLEFNLGYINELSFSMVQRRRMPVMLVFPPFLMPLIKENIRSQRSLESYNAIMQALLWSNQILVVKPIFHIFNWNNYTTQPG